MSGSIFISKEVELLLMERYFPSLYYFETVVKETWDKASQEEYGFHLLDTLIWMGIFAFLWGEDTVLAKNTVAALPYVGRGPHLGAVPLHTQFKAMMRTILLDKLGQDIDPQSLPADFLACEHIRRFQACYARFLLLSRILAIKKEKLKTEPGEELEALLSKAQEEFRDSKTEFIFRAKAHLFSGKNICTDCPLEEPGKIIRIGG